MFVLPLSLPALDFQMSLAVLSLVSTIKPSPHPYLGAVTVLSLLYNIMLEYTEQAYSKQTFVLHKQFKTDHRPNCKPQNNKRHHVKQSTWIVFGGTFSYRILTTCQTHGMAKKQWKLLSIMILRNFNWKHHSILKQKSLTALSTDNHVA